MTPKVKFRPAADADTSFLFSTFLKSYKENNEWTRDLSDAVFFDNQKIVWGKILAKAQTLIACSPDDDDQIFGYITYSNFNGVLCVHWWYTKFTFRKFGIGTVLLNEAKRIVGAQDDAFTILTHSSYSFRYLRKKLHLQFIPYLLEEVLK